MPLLGMPASARGSAMGDAYGAAHGAAHGAAFDAASLFSNPAEVAGVPGTSAAFSVERYLASSTVGALAVAQRLRRVAVGVGILALDYPDAEEFVPDASGNVGIATGGSVSAHELVAGLAVAAGGERRRAGAMLRYVDQSLPGARGSAMAVDVGVASRLAHGRWGRMSVAAAVQQLGANLETRSTSAPLPRTWRAGAALEEHPFAHGRWTVLAEVVDRRDAPASPRVGVEGAWLIERLELAARAGWTSQPEATLARPLTLGAGLRHQRLWLDYAWRRFGVLGATHRVGVRWQG